MNALQQRCKTMIYFFYNRIRNVLNKSSVQKFHLLHPFLIVLTQDVPNDFETLRDAFSIVLKLGLLNVNVLIKDEMSWSLYFYEPFIRDCQSFELLKISSFSPQNFTNELNVSYADLFPPKRFKFNNCPLNIATTSIEPFVIIRNASNGALEFDGIDVVIVNEIAITLNLIPKYINGDRGTVFENGTATGGIKLVKFFLSIGNLFYFSNSLFVMKVIDGDANMTIGTYTPLQRLEMMAHTHPYMQHASVFAFGHSSRFSTPIWRLMAPFQKCLWIAIALLLIVSISVILLTKKLPAKQRHFIIGGRMNRTPVLNMINVLIGNVIPNPRMERRQNFSGFARALVMVWMIFWLIVRSSYESSLYAFFQSQRTLSPYDTVEKVRNSKATIHLTPLGRAFIPEGFDSAK